MIKIAFQKVHVNKKLGDMVKDAPNLAAQALYTATLHILIPAIKENIRKQDAVFEGHLFQRIDARAKVEGRQGIVEVGAIGVPYGKAIEKGQKPGTKQNLAKLIRYARIKLGVSPKLAPFVGLRLKAKIERDGSKAKPFLIPAFKDNRERLARSFAVRLQTAYKKRMTGS